MLFQFGKFDKYGFKALDDFLARLIPFLKKLPKEHKFAVEIRNRDWLVPKFADVLREHGIALTLIDQGWMPRPWGMKVDLITSDFTYVPCKVIVDREGDLSEWVNPLNKVQERRIMILAFANNHYAGHGPGTVDLFRRLWGMEVPRSVHPAANGTATFSLRLVPVAAECPKSLRERHESFRQHSTPVNRLV